MPPASQLEHLDSFHAFDNCGRAFEVQVWAEVAYSIGESGNTVRAIGKKQLKMAGSGNVVNAHIDGSLEDSGTGVRLRMNDLGAGNGQVEARA